MSIKKLRPDYEFTESRLQELKQVVPEAFADGKINWDVFKEALGEHLEDPEIENFGLFWPGKNESRKIANIPPKGTLFPQNDLGINCKTTKNIFVEGENLEVLKILQKSYAGHIKVVYIDPPYNTGNDFIYSDDYSEPLNAYLKRTQQLNEKGELLQTNPKTSGRFHSNWLSMMYPRLRLAQRLLRDDGVIFVSIDDNEYHNLKLIMDEIFGEENFIANIIWQHNLQPKGYLGTFSVHHNYLICYQKSSKFELQSLERTEEHNKNYSNPDNDPKGRWRPGDVRNALYRPNLIYDIVTPSGNVIEPPENGWRWSEETLQKKMNDGEIMFNEDETRIIRKIYLKDLEGRAPETIWFGKEVGTTREATRELKELFSGNSPFDTPKPTGLIKRMLDISTKDKSNGIILDFFGGSCPTAQAVYEYNIEKNTNIKYLIIQLPEPVDKSKPSGRNAAEIGMDTVSDIGRERIRRVIKTLKDNGSKPDLFKSNDLGFKCYSLGNSSFVEWIDYEGNDIGQIEKLFDSFESPLMDGWKRNNLITEIILIEGFPLDSELRDVSKYSNNEIIIVQSDLLEYRLFICLDKIIDKKTIEELSIEDNDVFVCLESALSDQAKIRLDDVGNIHVI